MQPGDLYLSEQKLPKAALATTFPSSEPDEHKGQEHDLIREYSNYAKFDFEYIQYITHL